MIKDDVRRDHLSKFPNEQPIIDRFSSDFDITWGRRIRAFNTNLSFYFLKPRSHITETFGFEQEIILALSEYSTLEARSIQAIEQLFHQTPAKGRVDQTVAIVVSNDPNSEKWIREYTARNPQARTYVGFSVDSINLNYNSWTIRNHLSGQLFSRDLFDYTLPLDNDLFFFGRQNIVAEHIDAIRRSENRGIFGLRKTGKTSVLFKIVRQCEEADIPTMYFDCKIAAIYEMTGNDLLDHISERIIESLELRVPGWKKKTSASARFLHIASKIPPDTRLGLIFDEIEYISPGSPSAPHWNNDFVPFWQTVWSAQSQHRRFSFIIAGVNAAVSETDKYNGIQNPMFGIIKPIYLTGFDINEFRSLTAVFGRRMGIHFDEGSLNFIHSRYGGHPLLCRMVCSQLNNKLRAESISRPATVNEHISRSDIESREEELTFYCAHITSELETFYPLEYEMLEMLSVDDIVGFNDLAEDPDLVRHLKSYGLVELSAPFQPKLKIPVIKGYISRKWKKRTGAQIARYVVPAHRRVEYLYGRTSSILRELRSAKAKFSQNGLPVLYSDAGPAEAELFASSAPATTRDDLVVFLNQSNRTLIEPIDQQGRNRGTSNYYFQTVRNAYPALWPALNRVRAYRNNFLHLELNPQAKQSYDEYIDADLDGRDPSSVPDGWFRIQSAILDGVITSIQAEISKYD